MIFLLLRFPCGLGPSPSQLGRTRFLSKPLPPKPSFFQFFPSFRGERGQGGEERGGEGREWEAGLSSAMAGASKEGFSGIVNLTPHKIAVCHLIQYFAPAAHSPLPIPFKSVSQHNRLGLFLFSLTRVRAGSGILLQSTVCSVLDLIMNLTFVVIVSHVFNVHLICIFVFLYIFFRVCRKERKGARASRIILIVYLCRP